MTILFTIRYTDMVCVGCPIRRSMDITSAYDSPWLIAVNRVLLRLPVPRHSPCALYLDQVYIHAFLDGRDVPPSSAADYMEEAVAELDKIGLGKIATISGRFLRNGQR